METQDDCGEGVVCEQLQYGLLEKNIVRIELDCEVPQVQENPYVLELDQQTEDQSRQQEALELETEVLLDWLKIGQIWVAGDENVCDQLQVKKEQKVV